ncbi:rhodanese-like domain-containing protein [Nodosilinea sp. LEGE 06152]|uniref:rhodanese-like domain-containing protein n=1 Tax=Nodosilinea sp. LEGE 06152 TaxID=2777966 RepID=UPI001D1493EB|nr:rhodanese-like domain-containing protein [Nodosilinea sp. LEGE 06152]
MTNFRDQNESISNNPGQADQSASPQDLNVAERAEHDSDQAATEASGLVSDQFANRAEDFSSQASDQVQAVKSAVTQPLPKPPGMSGTQATADELLKRLNWGEPALTIIDARSRQSFNAERITGAMSRDQVDEATGSLEHQRDIYVYGDGADEAAEVVNQLRQAGYQKVALIQGGLSAWKDIGGPTEGVEAFSSPAGAKV